MSRMYEGIFTYRLWDEVIDSRLKAAPDQLVPTDDAPLGSAPTGTNVTNKQTEINNALAALTGEDATDVRVTLALTSNANTAGATNPQLPSPFNSIDVTLGSLPHRQFPTTDVTRHGPGAGALRVRPPPTLHSGTARNRRAPPMDKPILCLDFDGVIHSYASGWKGADVIPDPPVPGALEFIRDALNHFRVAIYSSRSGQPGGIEAMKAWLANRVARRARVDVGKMFVDQIEWPTEKPPAMVTIDDRAICFTGEWPDMDFLLNFQPWNRRQPEKAWPMDFGEAVNALKVGFRVCRAGWNGKGMWLELQRPDAHSKMTLDYIFIRAADGNLVPWVTSQMDVLAEDWEIVEAVPPA